MSTTHRIVQLAKLAVAWTFRTLGVLAWLRRRRARRGEVSILLFHRVAGTGSAPLPLAVPPGAFRALVRGLTRRYDVVSWAEARPATPADRPRAVITFDDGYADNAAVAWPILRESGVPALFCLTTAFVAGERAMWWDVVAAAKGASATRAPSGEATFGDETEAVIASLKTLPNAERVAALEALGADVAARGAADAIPRAMSWDDAIRLGDEGAELGGHTVTHPILTTCTDAEVTRELVDCRRSLNAALDARPTGRETSPVRPASKSLAFAYPNGDFDARIRDAVREAGFDSAFTIEKGPCRADTDPYRVPRLNVHQPKYSPDGCRFSWTLFEAEMLGVFDVLLARTRRR